MLVMISLNRVHCSNKLSSAHKLKSAVKEVPMLHFGKNEFFVNMNTSLIGLYFGKILSDLTPPQYGLCMSLM